MILILLLTTMQKEIQKFNETLVEENIEYNIVQYTKFLNELFYHYDITNIIDEIILLIGIDGFSIHHDMLEKYEVISLKSGSYDVKRLLEQYDFTEHEDYIRNIVEVDDGRTQKYIYYFTVDVFKTILMRCKNTRKFAYYFILCEKAIKYYNEYEISNLIYFKLFIVIINTVNRNITNLKNIF